MTNERLLHQQSHRLNELHKRRSSRVRPEISFVVNNPTTFLVGSAKDADQLIRFVRDGLKKLPDRSQALTVCAAATPSTVRSLGTARTGRSTTFLTGIPASSTRSKRAR